MNVNEKLFFKLMSRKMDSSSQKENFFKLMILIYPL